MNIPTLTIKRLDADEEGWVEVVLIREDQGEDTVGDTVGFIRLVEGTEDWWDVKVVEPDEVLRKRLMNVDEALLTLAFRHAAPTTTSLTW